jgi:DUF1680 family protein
MEPRDESGVTRRELLKMGLGAGALAAGLGFAGSSMAWGDSPTTLGADAALNPVTLRVTSFKLGDVQLTEGPFLAAQERDGKYLVSLEADRFLHNFRVNAGLPPKAEVYGGWESVAMWADIRAHGQSLGHYLTACSLMYASTGESVFKVRVDYIVSELKACQEAGKSGLICAFPEGGALFDLVLSGKRFPGVPWYTMHKIMAGLRDANIYCGNQDALAVLVKLCDWAVAATAPLSDEQFQHMLNIEHGGMNEVLADVYGLTGDRKYLTLSQRFCHRAVFDPLAQSQDRLNGLHANTQIPKVVGFNRLYVLTGHKDYLTAASFFWLTVVTNRSFVTGGHGDNEHFFPPGDFARHAGSAKNMETCCTYNMLRLTRMLFTVEPSAAYADYFERALYNGILASQDPDSGMMTYFQGTRPGYMKLYCTPVDSFWCCTGTGMENHAKYRESIYFREADGVYVNLFIPSVLNWEDKGITLTQTTRFPEEGKTKLAVEAENPVEATVYVRHPGWCKSVAINLNGKALMQSDKPGSFVAIKRTWASGDVLDVDLPMTLRTEALPGTADTVAFVYGPIVLAGALGHEGIAAGADEIRNERTYGGVLNEPFAVPTLAGDSSTILKQMSAVGDSPLTFSTSGSGHPQDVKLVPYYRIAHERYAIYWKLGTA